MELPRQLLFVYARYSHGHKSEWFPTASVQAIGKQVSNPFPPDTGASPGCDETGADGLFLELPGKHVLQQNRQKNDQVNGKTSEKNWEGRS